MGPAKRDFKLARDIFSSSVNKTRSWGLFWIDFLEPFKGDPFDKNEAFSNICSPLFGTSANKMSGKKKKYTTIFHYFSPFCCGLFYKWRLWRPVTKGNFFSSGKFWCQIHHSSQLKTPNSLSPQKNTHKKSREKGREFQSFISGVLDSPNPETPMFRSSEWYHLWQPVSEHVFWGQILQTNESDLMEKLFGPFFGRWGTTTTHRLLFGGKFDGLSHISLF